MPISAFTSPLMHIKFKLHQTRWRLLLFCAKRGGWLIKIVGELFHKTGGIHVGCFKLKLYDLSPVRAFSVWRDAVNMIAAQDLDAMLAANINFTLANCLFLPLYYSYCLLWYNEQHWPPTAGWTQAAALEEKTDDVVLSQTPMMKCKFESKFNLDYASHSGAYLVSIICI